MLYVAAAVLAVLGIGAAPRTASHWNSPPSDRYWKRRPTHVRYKSRLAATALAATAVVGSFLLGDLTGSPSADASGSHAYTLRIGDTVAVPSINQSCSVSTEGGAADLFCARPKRARHQVVIFRDEILVWTVGNPDRPAWTGKP